MTLTELTNEIKNWANTTETQFVAEIPTMIRNAERTIYAKVLMPDARATVQIQAIIDDDTIVVTGNIHMPLRMWVSGQPPLLRKTASFIRESYVNCAPGTPKHYAWLSSSSASSHTMLLGPTPDQTYQVNFDFAKADYPSLVTTTAGTLLSTNWPQALSKVTQAEAAVFLKQWDDKELESLKKEADDQIALLVAIHGSPQVDEVRQ
jgi:hypothetical protein